MSRAPASSGVDARRAGRHRPRLDARRLAAPGRTRSAGLLSDRRAGFLARRARALGLDVPLAAVDAGAGGRRLRARLAGRAARPAGHRRARASPTPAARRPRSPRSAARSPTCWPARAAAVVTNPVAKNVLYRVRLCRARPYRIPRPGSPPRRPASRCMPVMMLWSPELAVVPVTIHLPLREVVSRAHQRSDRGDRPHRRARSHRPLRHRAAAPRGRRAQSACRRGRRARRRRTPTIVAPAVAQLQRGGHRRASGRCRPTRCSTSGRARPTTWRCACITTRR